MTSQKLVGFRGRDGWAGGAFPSSAETLKAAAVEIYAQHGDNFITGRTSIAEVTVTCFAELTAAVFRVEPDGSLCLVHEESADRKQLQKLRHALARVPVHDERDGSTNRPRRTVRTL